MSAPPLCEIQVSIPLLVRLRDPASESSSLKILSFNSIIGAIKRTLVEWAKGNNPVSIPLLVRLRVLFPIQQIPPYNRFNSIIGAIKRRKKGKNRCNEYRSFNSIIGAIKRCCCHMPQPCCCQVSIPLLVRLRVSFSFAAISSNVGFNSIIGAIKRELHYFTPSVNVKFQFHYWCD